MSDTTDRRPIPARVFYAIATRAMDIAGLVALAALAGAIVGIGPTADTTDRQLMLYMLAMFGAAYVVADIARSIADALARDESTAADDAADALEQLADDLGHDANPELVLAGLRRTDLPGQLADIVTTIRDLAPGKDEDLTLTFTADHLRQAQHHLTHQS